MNPYAPIPSGFSDSLRTVFTSLLNKTPPDSAKQIDLGFRNALQMLSGAHVTLDTLKYSKAILEGKQYKPHFPDSGSCGYVPDSSYLPERCTQLKELGIGDTKSLTEMLQAIIDDLDLAIQLAQKWLPDIQVKLGTVALKTLHECNEPVICFLLPKWANEIIDKHNGEYTEAALKEIEVHRKAWIKSHKERVKIAAKQIKEDELKRLEKEAEHLLGEI